MAKRKPKQHPEPPLGEITLAKPDFEQALSFAEVTSSTTKPSEVPPPVLKEKDSPAREERDPVPQIVMPSVAPEVPAYVPSFPPPPQVRFSPPDKTATQSRPTAATLMPKDAATRKMLEARALVIAKPVGQQQYEQRSQYLRFRLGAVERYGIPYPYLEELRYVGNLARVPCTPAFVAGVVNHRGELLTILDLKQFFRMPALEQANGTRIIVVKHAGMRIGLLVDDVDGNEEYQSNELAPPLGSDGVSNMEYVLGIHAGRVTLLNLAALLNDPALRVTH